MEVDRDDVIRSSLSLLLYWGLFSSPTPSNKVRCFSQYRHPFRECEIGVCFQVQRRTIFHRKKWKQRLSVKGVLCGFRTEWGCADLLYVTPGGQAWNYILLWTLHLVFLYGDFTLIYRLLANVLWSWFRYLFTTTF